MRYIASYSHKSLIHLCASHLVSHIVNFCTLQIANLYWESGCTYKTKHCDGHAVMVLTQCAQCMHIYSKINVKAYSEEIHTSVYNIFNQLVN